MPETPTIYRVGASAARRLLTLASPLSDKLRRGHEGRSRAPRIIEEWATRKRDHQCPLVWFHASSVGEGLQAGAVLTRLRKLQPQWQYVYTHFSPSAESLAASMPADLACYLPYDVPGDIERALSLKPSAVVFSKLDLWPELACRASATGAKVALIAGTVRPESGRLKWPVRKILEPGYRALDLACAVSGEHAERLVRLGVDPGRIEVTGDPRYDSVVERISGASPGRPLIEGGDPARTMVAGSTWPEDEEVVLEAFSRVRRNIPDARLILVPHEPTEHHLAAVERRAASLNIPYRRLGQSDSPAAPLVIVDRTGVLAALYGEGSMAYVGGAFGSKGIHSVIEPAAWGIPVIFGPNWRHSAEAGLLIDAGAARVTGSRDSASDMAAGWENWLTNETSRVAEGGRARRVVDEGLGAADRTATLLSRMLLDDSPLDGNGPG